jgi:hypothetical protein
MVLPTPTPTTPAPLKPVPTTTDHSFWTDPDGPWWGIPVTAGIFLLLVALATFGANLLLKKMELGRGDRSKWDLDILEASTKIIVQCDLMAAVGKKGDPKYLSNLLDRIDSHLAAAQQMEPEVRKLSLIASKHLSGTGNVLLLSALREGINGDTKDHPDKAKTPTSEKVAQQLNKIPSLADAKQDFTDAVRQELRAVK